VSDFAWGVIVGMVIEAAWATLVLTAVYRGRR
jgi:hypothetical protein